MYRLHTGSSGRHCFIYSKHLLFIVVSITLIPNWCENNSDGKPNVFSDRAIKHYFYLYYFYIINQFSCNYKEMYGFHKTLHI